MIIAYTGLPGSGKSLSALQDYVLSQLKEKRVVFCNIVGLDPMCIAARLGVVTSDVCRLLTRFSMAFDDGAAEAPKKELDDGSFYYANAAGFAALVEDVMACKEAVFILDECHEYLASTRFRELESFKKYISMARHYGHDLVLITQHVSDIWEPLLNRIHETHNFVRGTYGFRKQYTEFVYHGCNVYARPRYTKSRFNDVSLYNLYQSRVDGAVEHLGYASIWRNKKLVLSVAASFFFVFFGVFYVVYSGGFVGAFFGWSKPSAVVSEPVNKYKELDNVVYVKYVVCGDYNCTATRPDGSTVNLPLDYDSGKYPVKIRRFDVKGNNVLSNALSGGLRPGVPNASR